MHAAARQGLCLIGNIRLRRRFIHRVALGRVAAITAGAILLSGCHPDDFVASLTHPIPEHFDLNKSTTPPHVSRWWTKFGSNELDRLMDEANFENLDIALAVAQLDQADAQAGVAGAPLWPQLNYAGNNQRTRTSGTSVPGIISPATERNSFSRVINASYVVDLWGQNRALLDAALHTANASRVATS